MRSLSLWSQQNNANVPVPETPNYKIMSIDDFPRYLRFPPSCVYQCQCTFLFSPASFLCSGGYFFGDKWAGKELPYVVHNNWIVGKANKLKRFKVFGVPYPSPPSISHSPAANTGSPPAAG